MRDHFIPALILGATIFGAAGTLAGPALAQVGEDFDPATWEFGPRWDVDGEVEIWNPVKQKILVGEPILGGTVRATDPRTYCAQASAGWDFTWTEVQHESITWDQAARMWRTCPGPAVPGVRVAFESEGNLQMPVDMGAAVIFVPTIDTAEEAQRAVDWVYFPPMGRRSAGGGQGPSEIWADVPGGFRQTWNDNVVLVMMIETLEGVQNAREIAKIDGVTGLFAAAGDIGNFSGYAEGDEQYEMLITEIVEAAQEAGKIVCGPLRWMGTRPEYNCFQGGHDVGFVAAGARAEIEAAQARWNARDASDAGEQTGEAGATGEGASATGEAQTGAALAATITGACGQIVYVEDCFAAIEQVLASAEGLPDDDVEPIRSTLQDVIANNPDHADRIRQLAEEADIELGGA